MAATAWSLDFCLVCDRQTPGAAYCSQACRLSEIDRSSSSSSGSEPSSPTCSSQQPWTTVDNHHPDFSRHHNSKLFQSSLPFDLTLQPPSASSNPTSSSSPSKALTPSSSQTSLASMGSMASSSSCSSLSCQIRSELEGYAGCFDQVRDWKRRLTSS